MPYDNYDYDFEDYSFDHTNIFILNPNKGEMELRGELFMLYTTIVLGFTGYLVSTFLANSSVDYRRAVNYYTGAYCYSTDESESDSESESEGEGESESESEGEGESESESESGIDYSPTKSGYPPSVRSKKGSCEEVSDDYDIPEPDYNESNLMEKIYRLD